MVRKREGTRRQEIETMMTQMIVEETTEVATMTTMKS
jgi:hypothetical protein